EPGEGEEEDEKKNKVKNKRGGDIKAGKQVSFSAKRFVRPMNALSSDNAAKTTHSASDVKLGFNNVSSLVDLVKVVPLVGGEAYKRSYVKSYGDGADYTAENGAYAESEMEFGMATIGKTKITAYCEEPNEMLKLPNADFDSIVEDDVTRSIRRKMAREILVGDGAEGHFTGIFHVPAKASDDIIDRTKDIKLTAIDDGTLDEIVFSFGGDEDVEDVATLILSKKDLKAFAKLRDKQGRKVYTILHNGNTGTIDGIQYVINSVCGAVTDAQSSADVYCMAYGPLSNYEMAVFSDLDAQRSDHYKFKEGQIAYRADVFAGGNVAAYNGFIRVVRPKSA
ncbi:phage major capsid protein, partial [Lachnospiraceae bacterium OttesenSCG-928-J05]|nr:phage major capsid protein [Lachnospiraceae bacterium OttesenSCG-928-J05]